nr:MAG TPA: RNA polymerase II-like protein [Caudoviricetes sp.]
MLDKGDIKPVVIPADAMKQCGNCGAERGTAT